MTPERTYEQPLFAVLRRHGFSLEGFNDRARGTYCYDVMSPYAVAKLHAKVGRLLTRWLQRRLRPWKGVVPARLDWFAGRGVSPQAATVGAARDARGVPLSDHAAIAVDLQR
jgi:hypothetical protein